MKRTSPVPKLDREQVLQAAKLTNPEIRFVVANYYAEQEARKRADMQLRHIGDRDGRPALLEYTAECHAIQEKQVLRMLENFAAGSNIGRWMLALHGVGLVIAAGMLAHLDIERAPTAGHFWSFAGLNPAMKWEKNAKRPYNADMKQLCFHFGECAKRSSNHPDSFYGAIYREQKAKLVARNEAGGFAEKAATFIYKTNKAAEKEVRESGKVPAGYLDRMATRFAAKIFLSHLHALMFWDRYGKAPPKPFAISIMGHAHEVHVPMVEQFFPGFVEAYYGEGVKKAA